MKSWIMMMFLLFALNSFATNEVMLPAGLEAKLEFGSPPRWSTRIHKVIDETKFMECTLTVTSFNEIVNKEKNKAMTIGGTWEKEIKDGKYTPHIGKLNNLAVAMFKNAPLYGDALESSIVRLGPDRKATSRTHILCGKVYHSNNTVHAALPISESEFPKDFKDFKIGPGSHLIKIQDPVGQSGSPNKGKSGPGTK